MPVPAHIIEEVDDGERRWVGDEEMEPLSLDFWIKGIDGKAVGFSLQLGVKNSVPPHRPPRDDGSVLMDESAAVFSQAPDIAVRRIVADIAKPALMIWDKARKVPREGY
jgi:hypothetical protein